MARIAITDGMSLDAQKHLESLGNELYLNSFSEEELLNGVLRDFDAVIVRSATKLTSEIIRRSVDNEGKLRVVGRAGVGVDNIDIQEATNSGVMVVNAPRSSTQSVVELTLGHLLSCARKIPSADRSMRSGKWEKKSFTGSELSGKAIGFIGFGRIAQGVAKIASTIGMEVHAFDPYLPPKIARDMNCRLHNNVEDVFRMCTHISVHCNLTDETYHLVNSERINLMPGVSPDGIHCGNHIINCARGGIVNENDVVDALNSGKLTSVALDVFEVEPIEPSSELLLHDGFHGTPHIGAATKEAQKRVGIDIGNAVHEALQTGTCDTIVNRDVFRRS